MIPPRSEVEQRVFIRFKLGISQQKKNRQKLHDLLYDRVLCQITRTFLPCEQIANS